MDEPGLELAEIEEALAHLDRVNRFTRGYAASVRGVAELFEGRKGVRTVLDVGVGGGDTARRLVDWGQSHDIALSVKGIDLSQPAIDYARRLSTHNPWITLETNDLFDLSGEESFDVVHAALMLHHLSDQQAAQALAKMYALSRLGVVVNDLHRHWLAYAASHVLLPALSGNRLIRHDGPLSVLRAFTRQELLGLVARAGLPRPRIRWHAPFRWLVVIAKERS